MKKQCNKILFWIIFLILLPLFLAELGFWIGNHNISMGKSELSMMHSVGNSDKVGWLDFLAWLYMLPAGVFGISHTILCCCWILIPLLTLLLAGSSAYLIHRVHPNAQKCGRDCIRVTLNLNRFMGYVGFIWALLGTLLTYIPIFWGILTMTLFAAEIGLLVQDFRIFRRLSLQTQNTEENDPYSAVDLEALKLQSRRNRRLLLLVFLSGLLLVLSMFLGSHNGLLISFSERLDREIGEMMGGGIFMIPFFLVCMLLDVVIFFPVKYGLLLGVLLAIILTASSGVHSGRNRKNHRKKELDRLALILETIPAVGEALLIVNGLYHSCPLSLREIYVILLYLAGIVLLVRGYWILPELQLLRTEDLKDNPMPWNDWYQDR